MFLQKIIQCPNIKWNNKIPNKNYKDYPKSFILSIFK